MKVSSEMENVNRRSTGETFWFGFFHENHESGKGAGREKWEQRMEKGG